MNDQEKRTSARRLNKPLSDKLREERERGKEKREAS
jgi:hypothetical protein